VGKNRGNGAKTTQSLPLLLFFEGYASFIRLINNKSPDKPLIVYPTAIVFIKPLQGSPTIRRQIQIIVKTKASFMESPFHLFCISVHPAAGIQPLKTPASVKVSKKLCPEQAVFVKKTSNLFNL
jgi:hypothetical protein